MSKPQEMSEQETRDVVKMMNDNKSSYGSKSRSGKRPQKSKKPRKSTKQVKTEKSIDEHYRAMKALLKVRSKSELIEIIWQYGVNLSEMTDACKVLLEENKALKDDGVLDD